MDVSRERPPPSGTPSRKGAYMSQRKVRLVFDPFSVGIVTREALFQVATTFTFRMAVVSIQHYLLHIPG